MIRSCRGASTGRVCRQTIHQNKYSNDAFLSFCDDLDVLFHFLPLLFGWVFIYVCSLRACELHNDGVQAEIHFHLELLVLENLIKKKER